MSLNLDDPVKFKRAVCAFASRSLSGRTVSSWMNLNQAILEKNNFSESNGMISRQK